MHTLLDYGQTEAERSYSITFPRGNLSMAKIPCLFDLHNYHEYEYDEILKPIPELEPTIKEMNERLKALEMSIAQLTSKDDLTKLKRELQEAFSGFLAEYLSKQQADASDATKNATYG
jgi:predicted nuclease with TOPRIM domain